MQTLMNRRIVSAVVATVLFAALSPLPPSIVSANDEKSKREYYELRVYRIESGEKQAIVNAYLEKALLPALNRMGVDRVGVFTLMDKPEDFSIYVLIPYPSLESFSGLNPALAKDGAYQKAAAPMFAAPLKDPAYKRIESRFMKAFAGMPVLELPAQTEAKKPRIFELRTYESPQGEAAWRKVAMFNDGEMQVMRDVKLGPVFFGETLIGDNVPNLTYMLSADDMDAHKIHWKAFGGHPVWAKMKSDPKYKDTVSKITNWFLIPTSYSQI